jgi:hypothetical protein
MYGIFVGLGVGTWGRREIEEKWATRKEKKKTESGANWGKIQTVESKGGLSFVEKYCYVLL